VARNGAGGAGRTSNRVSGPNLAVTRISFLFMFISFLGLGVKSEKPAIDWQSRVFPKSLFWYQNFIPTMPKARTSRCQMAIQPFTGACFRL
jgi:hypothetical protein